MNPYYQGKLATIYYGDCRELSLKNITALVTDPPYELGFMGKAWDQKGVSFQVETWQYLRGLCLSGAPLLSFGGTRTFHRIACAIEDAGWEIRDTLMWVYGSGFPKSLDISKAIDKMQGVEPLEKIQASGVGFMTKAQDGTPGGRAYMRSDGGMNETKVRLLMPEPTTPEAKAWQGYGTALKPAYEPIILGMNPLDGTFAENALKHKVAGLNIDGCRVDGAKGNGVWGTSNATINTDRKFNASPGMTEYRSEQHPQGRFPANFIHDGSQLVLELFPESSVTGKRTMTSRERFKFANPLPLSGATNRKETEYTDNGSAARFFYCAKASKAERDRGLEGLIESRTDTEYRPNDNGEAGLQSRLHGATIKGRNSHPTVKPLALMEYLVKLVKMPEYNLVLDPFMGSGTTLLACIRLGIPCIGIDNDEHTCEIAAHRCTNEIGQLVCT